MDCVKGRLLDGVLVVELCGRVDSSNAEQTEEAIRAEISASPDAPLTIDADNLAYISSAGLRVLLRLRKSHSSMRVINVSSDVYEVLEMTGFTEMLDVQKAYRRISVEGCEIIGHGSNGEVYRLDPDTIIKVYRNADALPEIHRERALARKAFVMGIPTAIPYDVVRVGDGYGSVFELLNARSFSKLIAAEPENLGEYTAVYVDLLRKMHAVEVTDGSVPDMKAVAIGWGEYLRGHLPDDVHEKLMALIRAVPESCRLLHGDYHVKNVMMQDGEVLLIDMDTLCLGDPVFEFGSIYNAYIGFCELDHSVAERFLGIPYEAGEIIWDRTVRLYFGTEDKDAVAAIKARAELIGQTRLLRRTLKRQPDTGKAQIEHSTRRLIELVNEVDSLSLSL